MRLQTDKVSLGYLQHREVVPAGRFAESLLPMLGQRDGEVESILYRYGMAVVHKR